MGYEPIDVFKYGTTVSIEADNEQVDLIVQAINRALPLFAEEGEHEIVAELRAILVEIEK